MLRYAHLHSSSLFICDLPVASEYLTWLIFIGLFFPQLVAKKEEMALSLVVGAIYSIREEKSL